METKNIAQNVENTVTAVGDMATGAAQNVIEVVTRPGSVERKGAATRRQAQREFAGAVRDTRATVHEVAGALLPERIALRGLRLMKARARRVDLVGEIAYRGLDLFHGSIKGVAGAVTRLERASEPPARQERPLGRAARTTLRETRASGRRTAAKSATRARRTARRAASAI